MTGSSLTRSARSHVAPFLAMDVMAKANAMKAAGRDVVSLAVGQPSDPVPQSVREVAAHALAGGRLGYTDAMGIPALRDGLVAHYGEKHGLDIDRERIVVTTGSSAGFQLAFTALFDPGQRIAIARPGYPAYRNIIAAAGLQVVEIPLDRANPDITADALNLAANDGPIHGLLVANPANPTGTVMARDDFADLIGHCRAAGIKVISDEIYHRLNFKGRDTTALELTDDVIVINSFSKYYCMTGWRIGWMVVPTALSRTFECLQQNLYISAPELAQLAAVEALKADEYYDAIRDRYALNRARLIDALPRLGMPLQSPADGAFYAYCDVSAHTNDSLDFSAKMLEQAGIAAPSGLDFDPVNGHRTMRLSYAGSEQDILTAIARLENWLKRD